MIRLSLLLGWAACAHATTVSEDFSTIDHLASSTSAVWNLATRRAHLPFYADTNGQGTDAQINIGTGRDGAFAADTFTRFDASATSTTVTLDTSRIYEFTTFTLPAGATLKATGTSALRIRVQGDVEIGGTIDLNGAPGADLGADTSASPAGGLSGNAGGARGGAGGTTAAGTDGVSADAGLVGSGKAGTQVGGLGKGGGGAGHDTAGAVGGGGAGAGAAGGDYSDNMLSTLFGGSGGGGGGSGDNASGAGGGGGGGALSFEVGGDLHVLASGAIECNGGDGGGTANGALKGGGGGGGSGGSMLLLVGGTLRNDGLLHALGGDGGGVTLGGAGGAGQKGRTRWVNTMDNNWVFNPVPGTEDPFPNMPDFGKIRFDTTGPFVVESSAYDTRNSAPTYTQAAVTGSVPATTTATLEIAGSSDDFVSDTTGFVPAADPSPLTGKRYFKFRLTLTSGTDTASPQIQSVDVTYTPSEQGKFTFGFAGCARAAGTGRAGPLGWITLIVYLISLPIVGRRRRARR